MALIDDVKSILNDLASHGWSNLFAIHGLDITANDLATELLDKELTIQRTDGFADFHPNAKHGIVPSSPAESLLFHGLASPAVQSSSITRYPTLTELDTIENYIYSLSNKSIEDIISKYGEENLFIALLSSEYRIAARTPHKRHADVVYCRTGLSRVGDSPATYHDHRRSFWLHPDNDGNSISVMPSKFNAFICIKRRIQNSDAVLDTHTDQFNEFCFPVHKLFSGQECISVDKSMPNLNLVYSELHLQEKLKKCHELPAAQGGLEIDRTVYDLTRPPFVRTSLTDNLVNVRQNGSICEIVPEARPIIEFAKQDGQFVVYDADPRRTIGNRSNRFHSSLQIPLVNGSRLAPEYVNMRFEIQNGAPISYADQALTPRDYVVKINNMASKPVHIIDNTCEGAVSIQELPDLNLEILPGYSVVAAIDFFPLVDQYEIDKFINSSANQLGVFFPQGGSAPLSNGRILVNPAILNPETNNRAFAANDNTLTAIMSAADTLNSQLPEAVKLDEVSTSFLSDAAANIFAPGWDLSRAADANSEFLSVSGLGSPFPEDAKLCAALNSFWPAAAPDASRTFAHGMTVKPLTEREVGVHNQHPFKNDLGGSNHGWDGEFGPFFQKLNGQEFVNFSSIFFSDYCDNMLKRKFDVSLLAEIGTAKLIERMIFLRDAYLRLDQFQASNQNDPFEFSMDSLHLVTFDEVEDWSGNYPQRIGNQLIGHGYRFIFAETGAPDVSQEFGRLIAPVKNKYELQYDLNNGFEAKIN